MRWIRRDKEHVVRKALAIPDKKKSKEQPQATWWTTVSKDMKGSRWRTRQPKIDCHGALKRERPIPNEKGKGIAEDRSCLLPIIQGFAS